MNIVFTLLTYSFPLILLLFEWGLRTIIGVDARAFTGPTLAAAGLTALIPLVKPKILSVSSKERPGAILVSPTDQAFVGVVWLLVLAFLFVWAATCYISIRHPQYVIWGGLSEPLAIGLATYFVSLIMAGLKEIM